MAGGFWPRRLEWLILLLLAVPLAAQAGAFRVSPVRLTLSAHQSTAVVHVTNDGSESTIIQLQVLAWSQPNGADVYADTRKLIATPPIFRLDAGSEQVVRVGLRSPPAASAETAYRMYLTQVPPPPAPGVTGLQIALRIGIPVFVEPPVKVAPVLQWTSKRLSPTKLEVSAKNTGNAHVQILELDLAGAGKPAKRESGIYLLPGTQTSWIFNLKAPLPANAAISVSAKTDQGDFHAVLSAGK